MADITMCEGLNCLQKENCHRFTAKTNPYRQSYFANIPLKKDGTCDHFWDNKDYKNENEKNNSSRMVFKSIII